MQRGFERGSSTGDQSGVAFAKQRVGASKDQRQIAATGDFVVELRGLPRSACDNIVAIAAPGNYVEHNRQHGFDFLLARAREQGDAGSVTLFFFRLRGWFNHVEQWMPNKFNLHAMFGIKCFFKGKDDEHLGHIALDAFDTSFLPRPYLRRNVVQHGDALFAAPRCNAQIEAGVVDHRHSVRIVASNVALAKCEVL